MGWAFRPMIADALQFMGAEISYFARSAKPDAEAAGMAFKPLSQLLAESEVVFTCLNKNVLLLGENEFAQLGAGKVLFNTSIGPGFDSAALESGSICPAPAFSATPAPPQARGRGFLCPGKRALRQCIRRPHQAGLCAAEQKGAGQPPHCTGRIIKNKEYFTMKTALTIAGSDSSGGAGIQADIKTMTANGVFAMSAITALTAQNTTGVTAIFDTTPQFLAQQLDAVFTDIYPDAVKIGMVSSAPLIDTIAERLHFYGAKHIVVDPVMVATSGAKLLQDDAVQALTEKLLPLAEVLTPNIPEAEILSGMTIANANDMEAAARTISQRYGCAVLCKGGHQINDADDLLWRNGTGKWFKGKRIANPNTHGTGCTLSSAIASNLAKGYDLDTAVERAKATSPAACLPCWT